LLIQKEHIYSNGEALIYNERSEKYVPEFYETLYNKEEQLLDVTNPTKTPLEILKQ
jgi:hypothetical protein